jgi:hypothetical protein
MDREEGDRVSRQSKARNQALVFYATVGLLLLNSLGLWWSCTEWRALARRAVELCRHVF